MKLSKTGRENFKRNHEIYLKHLKLEFSTQMRTGMNNVKR